MIKACFLIKYPPIQGGVSRHGYWLAREMAERGNHVYVVTNANEVEDEYRIYLDEDDREWYEPRFESSGGFVKVRNTQPPDKSLTHIPFTNPYVTKLASIATQVIRRRGCEVIFAYYLQPYGLAAYLASQWTGVPYVVRHAGSDLGRLMRQRDLTTAYREVLKAADCVWTGMGDLTPFLAMGVKEENLWRGQAGSVPQIFSPEAEPLDLNALVRKMAEVPTAHVRGVITNTAPIDLSKPTVGIYGKVGEVKGSFDLVSALGGLKRAGLDFNFVALTQGRDFGEFKEAVREHGLSERTWTLPFISHWRVPGFIRACTAVCFLERDFPISFHGPGIPKEILACGTCLILSGEIAAKQRVLRDRFVDGENVLLVDDPQDHSELAARLRLVIEQPERARAIGRAGRHLLERKAASPHKPVSRVGAFEEQLRRVVERRKAAAAGAAPEAPAPPPSREASLKARVPHTSSLLNGNWESLVERFCAGAGGAAESNPFNDAVKFCEFLETRLDGLGGASRYLADVLRYEKNLNLLYADFRMAEGSRPDYAASSSPFGPASRRPPAGRERPPARRRDRAGLLKLRPLKTRGVRVEAFDYDVPRLLAGLAQGEGAGDQPRERKYILFKKDLNFIGLQLELSAGTKRLLEFCDGERTVGGIVSELHGAAAPDGGKSREQLEEEVVAALRDLSARGIVRWAEEG